MALTRLLVAAEDGNISRQSKKRRYSFHFQFKRTSSGGGLADEIVRPAERYANRIWHMRGGVQQAKDAATLPRWPWGGRCAASVQRGGASAIRESCRFEMELESIHCRLGLDS